jgi:nitronate monooxygenase
MFKIDKVKLSGIDVLPIIEGGKGINVSTGATAGAFANAGAVGTLSGTNADYYDENGNIVRYFFDPKWTRKEKFEHLIEYSIKGAVAQAKIAHDIAAGNGRIHMNLLWEAGGTRQVLDEVLDKARGLIHGVTCGAGLPYSLSDFALKYNVYYYPIVSSMRAFKILWQRSFHKAKDLLGAVVYEDPWLAGGHNGLSNKEDPKVFQDPYDRIVEIRKFLKEIKLDHIPIIIAGGVWKLKEWAKYINNDEVGPVAFQFGTRPLLTKESSIPEQWKQKMLTLKEGDVSLNKFSPTGFYSSAINNEFLQELKSRSDRQMPAQRKPDEVFTKQVPSGNGVTFFYVKESDYNTAMGYIAKGFDTLLRTPDGTVVFTDKQRAMQIKEDQIACMGCLSHCRFSSWADNEENSTGFLPDPRSFCIQKTLQDVSHGGNIKDNLLFSGHQAFRFQSDEFYKDGFVPSIKQLVDRIMQGD